MQKQGALDQPYGIGPFIFSSNSQYILLPLVLLLHLHPLFHIFSLILLITLKRRSHLMIKEDHKECKRRYRSEKLYILITMRLQYLSPIALPMASVPLNVTVDSKRFLSAQAMVAIVVIVMAGNISAFLLCFCIKSICLYGYKHKFCLRGDSRVLPVSCCSFRAEVVPKQLMHCVLS